MLYKKIPLPRNDQGTSSRQLGSATINDLYPISVLILICLCIRCGAPHRPRHPSGVRRHRTPSRNNPHARWKGTVVVVVVCFHDLKFSLSSQLKAASCARCSSDMRLSKQVNGHSFTICLIVCCSPQSQSGEAM